MIPYIGDISKNDAILLAEFGKAYNTILEFGCGASTQVLAAYNTGLMLSIDTEPSWIAKTQENLKLLGIQNEDVNFRDYSTFMASDSGPFEFIFVDGADSLRREFAIKMWPRLVHYGCMAFHDTRRGHDFRNLIEVMAAFHDEIWRVDINKDDSNISVIYKKNPQPYNNWQITEKREPWQLGYGDPPQSFIDSLKKE